MMMGDPDEAAGYFEEVASAPGSAAQAAGNLGLGHALAASGRPLEAKEAFDAVVENPVVETPMRRGAEFGSASALYAAGEYEAAAKAFDALAAADPESEIGRDARYAAARARLAAGDRDAGVSGLQRLTASCEEGAEPGSGRGTPGRGAPRSLRNLDPRAVSRAWLRNYQRTGWKTLFAKGDESPLYTIGGCGLARATLRQVNAGKLEAAPVQQVAATTRVVPAGAPKPAAEGPGAAREAARAEAAESSSWLTWTALAAALVVVAVIWLRRGRR
jgi:tetratricopeptide (TPR) repeat protein